MAKRATVIGLGVIGGSIARGLKKADWHVTGIDIDVENAQRALELGYVDRIDTFTSDDQDIVFVAVPPTRAVEVIQEVLRSTEEGVVTDVASVKGNITRSITSPRFVPGHPMAGSEKSRLDGADPHLFDQANWILTPASDTDEVALDQVVFAIQSLGAKVGFLDPFEHDQLMAAVSHTPQLVAVSLVNAAFQGTAELNQERVARAAGPGFREMTRIASSDPGIWVDVCLENSNAIQQSISDVVARLQGLAEAIAANDREVLSATLVEQFARARKSRETLPSRPERTARMTIPLGEREHSLVFNVADQVGASIDDWYLADDNVLHCSLRESSYTSLWGGLTALGFEPNSAE